MIAILILIWIFVECIITGVIAYKYFTLEVENDIDVFADGKYYVAGWYALQTLIMYPAIFYMTAQLHIERVFYRRFE